MSTEKSGPHFKTQKKRSAFVTAGFSNRSLYLQAAGEQHDAILLSIKQSASGESAPLQVISGSSQREIGTTHARLGWMRIWSNIEDYVGPLP